MSQPLLKPLTVAELADLVKLKRTIDLAVTSWKNAWPALLEIRERKLYRRDCPTFEEFCQKHWGWTRQWVNEQIRLGAVVQQLPEYLETVVSNPNVARAVAEVPKKDRAKVLQAASKDGQVTRKKVEEAAAKAKSIDTEPIYRDEAGYQVPKEAMQFWERRQEIQDVLTAISRVKSTLEHARAKDDPLFRPISQACTDHLSRAYQYVTDAKPFAVCLQCQGRNVEKCGLCKGTGLIKEETYLTKNLEANRRIREKSYHLQPAV